MNQLRASGSPVGAENGRGRIVSLLVSVAVATVVALITRRPDAFATPQLWAEDSIIFLGQALELGSRSLLQPYEGYYHTLLRIVAWLALLLPARFIPAIYMGSSVTVIVLVAMYAARVFARDPGWRGWVTGAAAGFAVAAVPHTGEVFVNLTNLQWVVALGLVLLLLDDPPEGWLSASIRISCALVLSLTGPFSACLFLLFWIRASVSRTGYHVSLASIVTMCALVQFIEISTLIPNLPSEGTSMWSALGVVFDRTLGVLFVFVASPGWRMALELALMAGGVGLMAALWRRGAPRESHRMMLLILAVFAIEAAVFFKFKDQIGHLAGWSNGDRYFYVPRVLLLWVVVLVANVGAGGWWNRSFVSGVLILTLLGTARTWRDTPRPDLHWENYAPYIDRGEPVRIPINPEGWWYNYPGRKKPDE